MSNIDEARMRTPVDASGTPTGVTSAPQSALPGLPVPNLASPNVALSTPRLRPSSPVYWRVEGSLLELTTVRPMAFFTWNSQTFIERCGAPQPGAADGGAASVFVCREPRGFATRVVHAVLRGISRDRLDLLGEGVLRVQTEAAAERRRECGS